MTDHSVTPEPDQTTQVDQSQILYLQQRLESEQNLPLAIVGGVGAAILGAGTWAGITVASGYQIGFMAIGIGFLVGFAVRSLGKGTTSTFGVLGAALSLAGCALGNLLAVTAVVADEQGVEFLHVLSQLNPALIQELMVAFFAPMDILFYGISLYYGYKLSFRQLTDEDLQHMLSGSAAA